MNCHPALLRGSALQGGKTNYAKEMQSRYPFTLAQQRNGQLGPEFLPSTKPHGLQVLYRGIFGWFILWPFSCKYNTNTRQIACRPPALCLYCITRLFTTVETNRKFAYTSSEHREYSKGTTRRLPRGSKMLKV